MTGSLMENWNWVKKLASVSLPAVRQVLGEGW